MTLRRRLLLVYLIIVILSCVTVGFAVAELRHARRVVEDLDRWQNIVLDIEKLRSAFERDVLLERLHVAGAEPTPPEPESPDFVRALDQVRQRLGVDDEVRRLLNVLLLENYENWRRLAPGDPEKRPASSVVRSTMRLIELRLGDRITGLRSAALAQGTRTALLLMAVMLLTIVHIAIVGAILRRWLLRPMERLGRQVAALGRDEPPPEPLLESPAELAGLAAALESARLSLDEMRRRLIESERLTTVGQLAAQLAHNLRNPLASIRAAAQVTSKRSGLDEYTKARLDEIIATADRLNRWVTGLTEFLRPHSAQLEVADVVPVLEHVREAVAAELAAKEVSFSLEAPAGGLRCPHEPASLEQALVAAVVNGIEASPVGGRIVARVERDGATCRISIIDRGAGLPPGPPEQIFEVSFSTKRTGLGLGLSLARQAIQRQGGTVRARPNPEGGTIIEFSLPAGDEEKRTEG